MIDQGVFKTEWEIMCERWNREPSRAMAARYYQSLSARMDTESFRAVCRHLFDTSEFFPRPDDFVEAAAGNSEERALEEWDNCWKAMCGPDAPLQRMSEAGRKTLRLMGGIHQLRNIDLNSLPFVRKEFLRLYSHAHETYERERKELPPWTGEGRETFARLTKGMKRLESGDQGLPLGWEGVEPVDGDDETGRGGAPYHVDQPESDAA